MKNRSGTVIQAMQDGHMNETIEHQKFWRRSQQPDESFDNFVIVLHELIQGLFRDVCIEKSS